MRGQRGRARHLGIGCTLLLLVAAGCAQSPATQSLDGVVAERASAIEAQGLQRFTEFIAVNGERFIELDLELPQYQGLVSSDQWGYSVATCIESFNDSVRVTRLLGGFGVNYFGVVGDSYERVRWTIEGCMAQYGTAGNDRPEPGPIEIAWLYDDTVSRLLPCLRGLGISSPSTPTMDDFARGVAAGSPWNPVALAVALGHHERVTAVCPSSPGELERRMLAAEASS